LDEAFGFAIGARSVGSGVEVTQAMTLASGTEEMGAVAGAVIAHEGARFDAEGGEVSQGPLEEKDGAVLSFIGHDLGKGQTGSVIDTDMDIFPASAADLIAPVVSDTVTGPHDAPQLFNIEVKQFARKLALVAHHRRSGIEIAQPREPVTAQEP
jgi:hypothetical protein